MSTQTFRQRDGIAAYVAVQRMAPRRPVERRECTMRHAERVSFERRRKPSPDVVVQSAEPSWLVLIAGTVAVLLAWAVFALFVVGMLEVFAGLK